jgi:hypothetical protein
LGRNRKRTWEGKASKNQKNRRCFGRANPGYAKQTYFDWPSSSGANRRTTTASGIPPAVVVVLLFILIQPNDKAGERSDPSPFHFECFELERRKETVVCHRYCQAAGVSASIAAAMNESLHIVKRPAGCSSHLPAIRAESASGSTQTDAVKNLSQLSPGCLISRIQQVTGQDHNTFICVPKVAETWIPNADRTALREAFAQQLDIIPSL